MPTSLLLGCSPLRPALAVATLIALILLLRPITAELVLDDEQPDPPPASITPTPAPGPILPSPTAEPNDDAPTPPAVMAKAPEPAVIPDVPKPRVVTVEPPALVVARINERTEADVLADLGNLPVVALDPVAGSRTEAAKVVATNVKAPGSDATLTFLASRPDLAGLPVLHGTSARITVKAAKGLMSWGPSLKGTEATHLPPLFADANGWIEPKRIPVLFQVLTAGPSASRSALVRQLTLVQGRSASAALVRVALFDPHPDVRREAVIALRERPAAEYQPTLLAGLRYPWEPAAEHAAEALVALKRVEAVPALLTALKGRDPRAPYDKAGVAGMVVKRLVRVEHTVNCLLCHAPSFHTNDPGRAHVPGTGKFVFTKAPRGSGGYGLSGSSLLVGGTFIRADVTYLRQDYSVSLWKGRFDLLVRERAATPADVQAALRRKRAGQTAHQQAAAFALRELTGLEPGPGEANWHHFAQRLKGG